MELDEKAEEVLESLWICTEEKKEAFLSSDDLKGAGKRPVEQLLRAGYITSVDNGIRLTDKGRPAARNVVRRHRLAERLLADVLGSGDRLMHERACRFEHLLDRGLDESICILLGHPKICPHGKPIPSGRCCQRVQVPAQKLVSPLSQLEVGQKGRVAYIHAPESNQLQKLMAMGILPGASISLIQSLPSYVFRIRQTQFAVDKDIAEAIYVRLVEPGAGSETDDEQSPKRRKRSGLWRRFGGWW